MPLDGLLCGCVSATAVLLYTMTNHSELAIKQNDTPAANASATDTPPAVSTTRLWTRNPLNTTTAEAASVSTVRTTQPEVAARHAWRGISGQLGGV